MKVTSLKEVENFLYSSVIVPLKNLDVDLGIPNPIRSDQGQEWYFETSRTPVLRRARRNYQRRRQESNRDWQVLMDARDGHGFRLIAEYSIANHWVRMYEQPFRDTNSMMIFGKLYNLFVDNQPFSKVIVSKEPKNTVRQRRFDNPLDRGSYAEIDDAQPRLRRPRAIFETTEPEGSYDTDTPF